MRDPIRDCPAGGYTVQPSAWVRCCHECHQLKLFEVSLAHVILGVLLLLMALLARRLSR